MNEKTFEYGFLGHFILLIHIHQLLYFEQPYVTLSYYSATREPIFRGKFARRSHYLENNF